MQQLILPTFLYGAENWTVTALQRQRIEGAEIKLLRPLAGYTLYDLKRNDTVRRELQTECILDKIDKIRTELAFTLSKNATKRNPFEIISLQPTRKENIRKIDETLGESSYISGDGTDQRVQSLMFLMMMIISVSLCINFCRCCCCCFCFCGGGDRSSSSSTK